MTEPSAKVIADSLSPSGNRLTTMEIVMHRFVLAEFNTHRMFSRNSASSRAIPVHKQLEKVTNDPAYPVVWPSEQPGMQGGESLDRATVIKAHDVWDRARDEAVYAAQHLTQLGVHKSVTNRLLEPFMWHTAIVSSTEWDNFWVQRCSPLAQPEIHATADAMRAAYDASTPISVGLGEWHLPYIQVGEVFDSTDEAKAISAARCARVSYLTHDGQRDLKADLVLFERLTMATPPHASPLEHVATPYEHNYKTDPDSEPLPGNFRGWRQLRHEVFGG